jgi:hypothetical protein
LVREYADSQTHSLSVGNRKLGCCVGRFLAGWRFWLA